MKNNEVGDDGDLSDEEKQMATKGRKIQAIKSYRKRTGAGLAEAKDRVDQWMASNKEGESKTGSIAQPKPNKPGCGVGALFLGLALSGFVCFFIFLG